MLTSNRKVDECKPLVGTRVGSAWFQRLTLKYDKLPSSFAFYFKFRPYFEVANKCSEILMMREAGLGAPPPHCQLPSLFAPLTAVAVILSLSPLELSPFVLYLRNARAVAAVVAVFLPLDPFELSQLRSPTIIELR